MDILAFQSEADIERALPRVIDHLRANGVIAYPTETVYGIGCALRAPALARLARLKRRSAEKPFLLLVAAREQVADLEWTDAARRLADAFWPGPLTIALHAPADTFPPGVRSVDGTVAVRATSHAGMRRLLAAFGAPITSSSANLPGEAAALDAAGAASALTQANGPAHPDAAPESAGDVLVLDGGTLAPSPPSTLIDASCVPPRIMRAGALGVEQIRAVIGEVDAG